MTNNIQNITVPTNILAAVLNFASSKDVRYYLNGVAIQVKDKSLRVVATDGHVLGVMKTGLVFDTDIGDGEFIIPESTVKDIVKKAGKGACVTIVKLQDNENLTSKYEVKGLNILFDTVDGKFPDWRRVIPSRTYEDPTPGQFNTNLLSKFSKASKILGCKTGQIHVAHSGENHSGIVSLPTCVDFMGVIMPVRMPKNWIAKPISELRNEFV